MNIEDEFGVSISDEEAANLFTVQKIVEFLEKLQ
jgi:acyl carrier protein